MKNKKESEVVSKKGTMQKKLGVFLMVGVALSAMAFGAWSLGFNSSITGLSISSDVDIFYNESFTFDTLNSSDETITKSDIIEIVNGGSAFDIQIEIIENVTDYSDACNNSGDVEVEVTQEYSFIKSVINDSNIITIPEGMSNINITTSLVKFACPQTVETRINIVAI